MRLYTGYFAMTRHYKPFVPVSIALKTPVFFTGRKYTKVSPTEEILRLYKGGYLNREQYSSMYRRDVLSKLDPHKVARDLENLCGDAPGLVLLCYEKPGDLCHRHLLAEWLSQHMALEIEEYQVEKNEPKQVQMRLM